MRDRPWFFGRCSNGATEYAVNEFVAQDSFATVVTSGARLLARLISTVNEDFARWRVMCMRGDPSGKAARVGGAGID